MITKDEYLKAKEIIKLYELENSIENKITKPEWLSVRDIEMIKELWNTPNINGSNPKVKAIKLIQSLALSSGYKINIEKSHNIIKEFCV